MNEVSIDIHGMTVDMAKREIERLIAQLREAGIEPEA